MSNKKQKPMAKSKGKPTQAVVGTVVATPIVLTGEHQPGANRLQWTLPPLSGKQVIKHCMVTRKFWTPDGVLQIMQPQNDPSGLVIISPTVSFDSPNSCYDTRTGPWDYTKLLSGTYEYYVTGSYGDYDNSMDATPYFSNRITLVVP